MKSLDEIIDACSAETEALEIQRRNERALENDLARSARTAQWVSIARAFLSGLGTSTYFGAMPNRYCVLQVSERGCKLREMLALPPSFSEAVIPCLDSSFAAGGSLAPMPLKYVKYLHQILAQDGHDIHCYVEESLI